MGLDKINNNLSLDLSKKDFFYSLEQKKYSLEKNILTLSNKNEILSLPGIIGNDNSKCTLESKNILLEAAYFDKTTISKSGRLLNINTDSRYRFERNINKNMILPSIEKATIMKKNLCGGDIS